MRFASQITLPPSEACGVTVPRVFRQPARSAGLPTGRRAEGRLQMHLASPTSPANVAHSSDIMKKSFSATCRTDPERKIRE
jgi:hypothetical protein